MQNSISKITKAKGAGGVPEVIECLSRKREALSSNYSTVTIKKKIEVQKIFRVAMLIVAKTHKLSK
jgi:dihydroxyacid dehydratase/phosphogluconate dehydratase